jgi:hypothetical protein
MRSEDQIARGAVDYGSPRVTALTTGQATVEACVHDAEIVVSAASGRPVEGVLGQVDYELFISTMESTGSGWKLLTQRVEAGRCG